MMMMPPRPSSSRSSRLSTDRCWIEMLRRTPRITPRPGGGRRGGGLADVAVQRTHWSQQAGPGAGRGLRPLPRAWAGRGAGRWHCLGLTCAWFCVQPAFACGQFVFDQVTYRKIFGGTKMKDMPTMSQEYQVRSRPPTLLRFPGTERTQVGSGLVAEG